VLSPSKDCPVSEVVLRSDSIERQRKGFAFSDVSSAISGGRMDGHNTSLVVR
jgi:hypothetical protein